MAGPIRSKRGGSGLHRAVCPLAVRAYPPCSRPDAPRLCDRGGPRGLLWEESPLMLAVMPKLVTRTRTGPRGASVIYVFLI